MSIGNFTNNMKKIFLETRALIILIAFPALTGLTLLFSIALIFGFHISVIVFFILFSIEVLLFFLTWFWLIVPYKQAKKELSLFSSGYSLGGLYDPNFPLSKEMENVQKRMSELLNPEKMMSLSKRQAQFIALQNQINPHFLYNTLEGIRSEALLAGIESIANMSEALSTFFRYTISLIENLVPLKMEIDNAKNYFFIQQYRFGKHLHLNIQIDKDDEEQVLKYKIPKLTLQPIIENSIIHGLEEKIGECNLLIKIITTKDRLLITVSDDGIGIDEATLKNIQNRLIMRSFNYIKNNEENGGIALQNVNNRIKLLFGEEYGLSIESCVDVGTDVHISLPCKTDVSTEFSGE